MLPRHITHDPETAWVGVIVRRKERKDRKGWKGRVGRVRVP